MKVPWTEHKTNEEILKMVEAKRKLMDIVRSRQKRWLGHILRHDSLLKINTKILRSFITVKAHCSMTHLKQQKSFGLF